MTIAVTILVGVYAMLALLACLKAAKVTTGTSLWRQLFGGLDKATETWTNIGIGQLVPVAIAWTAAAIAASLDSRSLLYLGCFSTLVVMVTLESSLLKDLLLIKGSNTWRGLLILTLVSNFVTIVFLAGPVGAHVGHGNIADSAGVQAEMITLTTCSFLSSSFVILFSKEGG